MTLAYPKSKGMRAAEARLNEPLEKYLRRELNQRTQSGIAQELGVTPATLGYWMLKLGIRRRYE